MNNLIDVVRACEKKKGNTLESGDKRQAFGDDVTHPPKYNCFGVQANRAKTSVTAENRDTIMKMIRWSEICINAAK
jgi:hypothetical protein